ncbi:glycosyltransferase family 4 protein [Halococcus sp. AFM35]|uniref:glycosyltransferase family 4 protein n=1 Tax=Halococcus sp. AFM35 TaxID=3421653 RepID=UPI003EB6EDDA
MAPSSILYTCRIGLQGPISTIHREVTNELLEYHVTAFGDQVAEGVDKTVVVPDQIGARDIADVIQTYGKKYDIVHTGPRNRDYLAWLTTVRGAKHVHTLHAAPNKPKIVKRERRLATHADHVTAVSKYVKQWALDTLDIDEPITVIPNGVDMDAFEPVASPAEQRFVFVGRLVERKHPEQVLQLARKRPEATFKIRGSGPLESEIVDTAQSLDNVELVPKLDYEELADLYANATATLCPYEHEGFGMVVIESMASGTPVVGLDSGNLPSLIETGRNGILCGSLDLDEWLDALEGIQTERGRFEPRESISQYSWESIAEQYEHLYDTVL